MNSNICNNSAVYRLSDWEAVARAGTDVLFRRFLQVPVRSKPPDASTPTRFRGRLGEEGFQRMFDRLVGCTRDTGLIRDRLRLKDAGHMPVFQFKKIDCA